MNKKILFIAPIPPPYTGQSIISKKAYEIINPQYTININSSSKILGNILSIFKILSTILFNKIDIVYFTGSRSKLGALKDLILIFLCSKKNIKTINHIHGNDINNLFIGFLSRLFKESYNKVDIIIFLFEGQTKAFESISLGDQIVIPNCYNEEYQKFQKNNDSRDILFLSNIMYTKGIILLLKSIAVLFKKFPNSKFNIAGLPIGDKITTTNKIQNVFSMEYEKLKLEHGDRINYLGVIVGQKKLQLLKNSSILVLPTFHKSEAMPIAIIEGMRMGCAIVTTDLNYLPEMVTPKNGVLVTPNSINSLTIGIEKLLQISDDKLTKIQQYNIKEAKKKHSPLTFQTKLKAVIDNL